MDKGGMCEKRSGKESEESKKERKIMDSRVLAQLGFHSSRQKSLKFIQAFQNLD